MPERLLMVLMYMRLYVTETLLGYLFDLDGSTVGRERNHRMMPALLDVLPVPLRTELGLVNAPAEARRIGTLEELLERFPDLKEEVAGLWGRLRDPAVERELLGDWIHHPG